MRMGAIRLCVLAAALDGSCQATPPSPAVGCTDDARCSAKAMGHCIAAPSGNRFCAYSDPTCPSSIRWDAAAGEGLAGQCLGTPAGGNDLSVGGGNPPDLGVGSDLAGHVLVWKTSKPTSARLRAVWGTDAGNIFAVGEQGVIVHSADDGATWKLQPWQGSATDGGSFSDSLRGVWGPSRTEIFAVGSGRILHTINQGQNWTELTHPSGFNVFSVWGSSANDVYVVGDSGFILHSIDQGKSWQFQTSHTGLQLASVTGASASDVYAGGSGSALVHTTDGGQTWAPIMSGVANTATYFNAVFIPPLSNDLLLGGSDTLNGGGVIVHKGAVTKLPNLVDGLWGLAGGPFYAVGPLGELHQSLDGTTWTLLASPTQNDLYAVWGASASDVFVVGDSGIILHGQ